MFGKSIMFILIFLLAGCSSLKNVFRPEDHSVPVRAEEDPLPPVSVSSEIEIENIRQTLNRLQETLGDIQKARKKRKVVMFSEPVEIMAGEPLKNALSGFRVDYDPETLGDTTFFKEDVRFESNVELFGYIEDRFGYFIDETETGLLVSRLKTKEYNVSFLEPLISRSINEFLHDENAQAVIQDNVGIMAVTDDVIGHRQVEKYLKRLRDTLMHPYGYDVRIDRLGERRVAVSGEITPVTPVMLGGGGQLHLTVKGGRMFVRFQHTQYPASVAFFLPEDGGVYTAREGDTRLRIVIRKEPIDWVEAAR
jgi:hypothetical protein